MTTSDTPRGEVVRDIIIKPDGSVFYPQGYVDELLEQIAEKDAALAVLVTKATRFHDNAHDYESTQSCQVRDGVKADCSFKKTLNNLPESAKQAARVIEAARKLEQAAAKRMDDCLTGALITPEIDAIHAVILAVRLAAREAK